MRELVIKIDEGMYEDMLSDFNLARQIVRSFQATITDAIQKGVLLPEGHGRLIDADKLEEDMNDALKNSLSTYEAKVFVEFMNYVDDAPTILEANKEDE